MGEQSPSAGPGAGLDGYLASGTGAGLGVVVLHGRQGADDHIRSVCDRLAAEGFTALAPDLAPDGAPGGAPGTQPAADSGEPAARAVPAGLPGPARRLSAVVDSLLAHESVRGGAVGVIGFGTGGALALELATLRPDRVGAVVPFDNAVPSTGAGADLSRLEAPVEFHFAEHDDRFRPDAVEAFEADMRERDKEVRIFSYPGAAPGFFDDSRPETYDEDAARQAWVRTLEFLRAKLG